MLTLNQRNRISRHHEPRVSHLGRRRTLVGKVLLAGLALIALASLFGCAAHVKLEARGSMFRSDAMASADAVAQARTWLAAGNSVEQVVALLIARGIDGTEAERIAALAAGK